MYISLTLVYLRIILCAISSCGGGGPPTVGRWEGPSTWGEASRKAGNMKLKNACIMSMNKRQKNSSPGDYNFEAYFPKIILSFLINISENLIISSRSVIDMMHYYDKHGYSRW